MENQLSGSEPSPPTTSAPVLGAPTPLTPLIGRLEETAEIVGLLGRTRLLTVTGPGGGGKTRLALAVAQQWATAHPVARVVWVSLAGTEEPELVAEQFATAVGAAGPAASELTLALGGSDGLRVVDNCEHLLEIVAGLVGSLLVECPDLRVMATSRTPLHLSAERRWPLPPLRTPAADEASDVLGYDAVQLFLDRARSVRPDFDLDGEDAARVDAICRRLDGNPLAIELCAARTQVLGLSQLASGLDDAGRLLAGRDRSAPPRHRTLWDALDWSHRLLSRDEARMFATLGVFAGSPDLEAVSAVHGSDSLDALTALVEHSLVRPTTDPVGALDGKRFELADPVRQYARLRLQRSGCDAKTRNAHLRWCAGRAGAAFAQTGHREQSVWFARLRADLPDLRAALAWAHATSQSWTELRLAADLAPFATAAGLHREGRAWLEQALTGHVMIPDGPDGPDCANVRDGFNGRDGLNGGDGPHVPNGPNGPDPEGPDGSNCANVRDGPNGRDSSNGGDDPYGGDHTNGPDGGDGPDSRTRREPAPDDAAARIARARQAVGTLAFLQSWHESEDRPNSLPRCSVRHFSSSTTSAICGGPRRSSSMWRCARSAADNRHRQPAP